MLWSGPRGHGWPLALQGLVVVLLALMARLAFLRLGFGPAIAVILVAGVAVGGWINVPLTRFPSRHGAFPLGLNVGGALIPLAIAGQQATRLPSSHWAAAAIAISAVAVASFASARKVPSQGVFVPWLLPGMLAAALGLVLAPPYAPAMAFLAAVVGSFVSADLLTLKAIAKFGAARAVLGGAGPFDGLLWTGLLAALLTGQPS